MAARYVCGRRERRDLVRASPALNGIDFLEVIDGELPDLIGEVPAEALHQRLLAVRFLKPVSGLGAGDLRIEGGVRVTPVRALWAHPLTAPDPPEPALFAAYRAGEDERDHFLMVRTDSTGDYSSYTLALVDPDPTAFDPRLSAVEFSFKVECAADFDCKDEPECPPPELTEPAIDYLAKDYASFRRLIFDRMSVLAPDWRERNPSDLGVALVELLAYAGDQLSYFQDAVATEAYLGTARRRISVRRHARLVDYFLDEGANARVWVHFEVAGDVPLPQGTPLATRFDSPAATGAQLEPAALAAAVRARATLFETLHPGGVALAGEDTPSLRAELGELRFYTWSDLECCLPAGATAATLRRETAAGELSDALVSALEGTFLLFEEVVGPETGSAADADPGKRHVVRLTAAKAKEDPLDGTRLIEIEWDGADALPFPLCLSARTGDAHGASFLGDVSVARGNLVLADHGRSVVGEDLGTVDDDPRFFRPELAEAPLTHAYPLPAGFAPVSAGAPRAPAAALVPAPREAAGSAASAEPSVRLTSTSGESWRPRRDLLASGRFDAHLVAEMDRDGRAHLRFGDDVHGRRPDAGEGFTASYRVGGGPGGNLGAGALRHVFLAGSGIRELRNPLPAAGGRAPESLEQARRYAPQAFRVQERAVTEEDYARAAERHPEVQKAAATFRWTGSWHTVFVTVDRRGGLPVDAEFEERLRRHLEFFRMAGYDLEVDGPRFVSLDLALSVCVAPGYLRSDVQRELLRELSACVLADGRRGLFHPDRWTFGQPVYLSRIVAAASAVAGVESVVVTRFQRWGRVEVTQEREDGVMPMSRLEIARLDNDPGLRENGRLEIELGGGR